MDYIFELPIGDWSDDGHGKTDTYIIKSTHPVEFVREAYFKSAELFGFRPDPTNNKTMQGWCSDYEEYNLTDENFDVIKKYNLLSEEIIRDMESDKQGYWMDTEVFAQLVLNFTMAHTPELKLEISPEDKLPMFQFYGVDSKYRHIGFFGYGLFN